MKAQKSEHNNPFSTEEVKVSNKIYAQHTKLFRFNRKTDRKRQKLTLKDRRRMAARMDTQIRVLNSQ